MNFFRRFKEKFYAGISTGLLKFIKYFNLASKFMMILN